MNHPGDDLTDRRKKALMSLKGSDTVRPVQEHLRELVPARKPTFASRRSPPSTRSFFARRDGLSHLSVRLELRDVGSWVGGPELPVPQPRTSLCASLRCRRAFSLERTCACGATMPARGEGCRRLRFESLALLTRITNSRSGHESPEQDARNIFQPSAFQNSDRQIPQHFLQKNAAGRSRFGIPARSVHAAFRRHHSGVQSAPLRRRRLFPWRVARDRRGQVRSRGVELGLVAVKGVGERVERHRSFAFSRGSGRRSGRGSPPRTRFPMKTIGR